MACPWAPLALPLRLAIYEKAPTEKTLRQRLNPNLSALSPPVIEPLQATAF
jgi:hypothetical protein